MLSALNLKTNFFKLAQKHIVKISHAWTSLTQKLILYLVTVFLVNHENVNKTGEIHPPMLSSMNNLFVARFDFVFEKPGKPIFDSL